MTREPFRYPQRLVEEGSATGRLLRAGLAEPLPGPREARTWAGLAARRAARQRGRTTLALAVAAAGVLGLSALWFLDRAPATVALTAETPPAAPRRATPQATEPTAAVRERALPARRADVARPAPTSPPSTASAASAAREVSGPDTTACARLVRDGQYEKAGSCYERIARGGSMSAELALYEQARLEARALARPSRALETLEAHRQRFPDGVLSAEVTLTRIELLAQLGRAAEALDASATALAGPLGAERAGDLRALRGELLAEQGDCDGARRELELARQSGVHPSRLARGSARCGAAIDGEAAPAPAANEAAP